ncbi:MAG: hypothetical protein ACWGHV_19800 [Stutzerimonas stutzeri]
MLTLFITPVIYLFFDRLGQRFGRRREPLAEAQRMSRTAIARGQA